MASKKNRVPVIDIPSTPPTENLPVKLPVKSPFPRVKEAREALKERAMEIFETYLAIINEARVAHDYDTAFKATQWLIEHMPKGDGESIVDPASTKEPTPVKGGGNSGGPVIQIGLKLGGIDDRKALPSVIDVETDE